MHKNASNTTYKNSYGVNMPFHNLLLEHVLKLVNNVEHNKILKVLLELLNHGRQDKATRLI